MHAEDWHRSITAIATRTNRKCLLVFAERHAYVGACISAVVAAAAGDDERRHSGRREREYERTVERAASVAAAATSWPWCGNTRARGATRCSQSGDQPRESAKPSHPRVLEQHRWWVWLVSTACTHFCSLRYLAYQLGQRYENEIIEHHIFIRCYVIVYLS